jgi:hypothetical protein
VGNYLELGAAAGIILYALLEYLQTHLSLRSLEKTQKRLADAEFKTWLTKMESLTRGTGTRPDLKINVMMIEGIPYFRRWVVKYPSKRETKLRLKQGWVGHVLRNGNKEFMVDFREKEIPAKGGRRIYMVEHLRLKEKHITRLNGVEAIGTVILTKDDDAKTPFGALNVYAYNDVAASLLHISKIKNEIQKLAGFAKGLFMP